jgi:hypothetical protein
MSRLGSWFRSAADKVSINASASNSNADLTARQMADVEDAMAASGLIMNDDIDGAEEALRKGDSVFHELGLGVTNFMRSILGFEKDVMSEAATKLMDCENRAWAELKKAQKESIKVPGRLYPPGTEYSLVLAQTQLMSCVVAVMQESLTEGIKGFYKLRKAFIALDAIMQIEATLSGQQTNLANGTTTGDRRMPGSFDDEEFVEVKVPKEDDSDLEFVDAKTGLSGMQTPLNPEAHPVNEPPTADLSKIVIGSTPPTPRNEKNTQPLELGSLSATALDLGPDSSLYTNQMDIFIHSGAGMCFGILLVIISMVPPAFSRLLYIIGFKGDRQRGIRMLWRSTVFPNVNGAVAGLILLSYYNGLLAFADIQPSKSDFDEAAEMIGYPAEKCASLQASMREQYPESRLWRLEEARLKANTRNLDDAIAMLSSGEESKMRQVTALSNFELSIDSMFVQDWNLMRQSFLRCVELNGWSHAMYYYMAGCAELELYRDAFHASNRDNDEVRRRKKLAEELIRKAPAMADKKKFMARQLPFEAFVIRKVQKWEERAKELEVDLADAVGVSAAGEMVYLWNGSKRMNDVQLERAFTTIDWGRCTAPADKVEIMKKTDDEAAIWAISTSALLRTQGKYEEARAVLEETLKLDRCVIILCVSMQRLETNDMVDWLSRARRRTTTSSLLQLTRWA